MEHYGRVDALANIAGGSLAISQPVDEISLDGWEKGDCPEYAIGISLHT